MWLLILSLSPDDDRVDKSLWTENAEGVPTIMRSFQTQKEEGSS